MNIRKHEMNPRNAAAMAAPDRKRKLGSLRGLLRNEPEPELQPDEPITIADKEALLLLRNYEETKLGWFWSTDRDGNITYITDSLAELIGVKPKDLIGSPFLKLFARRELGEESQRSLPFLLTKRTQFIELPLQAAIDGQPLWWAVSGVPIHGSDGEFRGYRGVGTDVTEQRESAETNAKLAMHDVLTGLSNRASISNSLERTLNLFESQKRNCAIMLIDLDRFKIVNDSLGHPAGDGLLQQVAKRLTKVVEDSGEVARIGGDEFQVMLPNWHDKAALADLANMIIESLSQPYSVEGTRCVIGASVGIAISPFDGDNSEQLIKNADIALYAAKAAGKGQYFFFTSDLEDAAAERRALEQDLTDAIARDQLSLLYQPIVDLKNNVVSGFEALIRWNHAERGNISPEVFIPIAEETNIINALGAWALRTACSCAATWPGDVRVAVNVSPMQFKDEGFPEIVADILRETGLKPNRLELEVTESVFLEDTLSSEQMFADLKEIGVRLALDDFGTGYSSLGYLHKAPFDKIKIDRSFIKGASRPDSKNGPIIAAIVALARALGAETTAEGVEALDELDWIKSLDVSHVQGYVFSRPIDSQQVIEKFAEGDWEARTSGPKNQRAERITMLRKVGVHYQGKLYPAVIRNISETGALMEGLYEVPVDTRFEIDFGEGRTTKCTVCRSLGNNFGVEFDEHLIDDGNGGYCPRREFNTWDPDAKGP